MLWQPVFVSGTLGPLLAAGSSVSIRSLGVNGAISFALAAENSTTASELYYVPPEDKTAPMAWFKHISWSVAPNVGANVGFTAFITDAPATTSAVLDGLYATYLEDDIWTKDFIQGRRQLKAHIDVLGTRFYPNIRCVRSRINRRYLLGGCRQNWSNIS
jgi:hypothetical protein